MVTQHKQSGSCLNIGAREAWNFVPCRSNRKATTQEKQEEQPPNCKYVCAVGSWVVCRVQSLLLSCWDLVPEPGLASQEIVLLRWGRDREVLADDTAFVYTVGAHT
jgi:hypothetical protein